MGELGKVEANCPSSTVRFMMRNTAVPGATPPTAAAAPARELVCPAGGWRLGEREAAAEAAMGRAGGPWPARYDDGYGRRHGAAAKLGYAH